MARLLRSRPANPANTGSAPGQSVPLWAVPSRDANTVLEQGYEPVEIPNYIPLLAQPNPSDEQGQGKTLTFQWPWQRYFQSLVPKALKMGAGWPNYRLGPPRPEQSGWSSQYLLFYEQVNRHAWPGGYGAPQGVIEHPETVPLTSLAPRL